MTTYAAYDKNSIYALGHTPEAAIQNARNAARDPETQFSTAPIHEPLAEFIDEHGWNGMNRTFCIDEHGYVQDTTGE